MLSKAIFKQTLKSNYKLWIIFTTIMCVMSALIIAVFDPKMFSGMTDMVKNMPGLADMLGDRMDKMTSLLGILSESFYTMQGIILALIFIIMTANSLIASQVDRGSMAYLLSTPTKRITVVRTQAVYLISSIVAMFLAVTMIGLATVQIAHGGIFTKAYTTDVKAAATLLEKSEADIENNLNLILKDDNALKEGANSRNIEVDVYTAYLNQKMTNNAYQAAASTLGIDVDKIAENPALIKESADALSESARVMGMEPTLYSAVLDQIIAQQTAASEQSKEMQTKIMTGITAAADVLKMDAADLVSDMGKIKENPDALTAMVTASGLPEQIITPLINQQLAADEITIDKGIDFSVKNYLMMNLGALLLMFAISGISFLFSCIFNLSKNSLALGAGIPVAFFIFHLMAQIDESLEGFKYLTLNTLLDTNAIISGNSYWFQFTVLAVLGVILYVIGAKVFTEKDLPL